MRVKKGYIVEKQLEQVETVETVETVEILSQLIGSPGLRRRVSPSLLV